MDVERPVWRGGVSESLAQVFMLQPLRQRCLPNTKVLPAPVCRQLSVVTVVVDWSPEQLVPRPVFLCPSHRLSPP